LTPKIISCSIVNVPLDLKLQLGFEWPDDFEICLTDPLESSSESTEQILEFSVNHKEIQLK
jgi:hypothetical protein